MIVSYSWLLPNAVSFFNSASVTGMHTNMPEYAFIYIIFVEVTGYLPPYVLQGFEGQDL